MKTNIQYESIFPRENESPDGEFVPFPNTDEERYYLFHTMYWGGYFNRESLDISKFLREDLSINLERLEIAVSLIVEYLEAVTPFDDVLRLWISGIDKYYFLRNITDKPHNQKEEFYFIRHFIQAVADNESVKSIKVEYVPSQSDPHSRGQ